jgi:hypothetical protein
MAMRDGKRTLLFVEESLAELILPVARTWVASWLIDPFVLVPVPASASGAPLVTRMPGTVIGRDGTREVDVFALLAQGEYELVRFLALQAIEPGRPILDRDALVEYATSLQQAASPATRFWRLNLMVFPTAVAPEQPLERVLQGWETNVIAAPENRASDRSFDAFIVAEGRGDYAGHLLGNAATAGAMWCGMDVGPYDERTPSGGAATLVALQRTFVRAVVMDDFLVRIARTGLTRLIADTSPFDDPILMAGGHLIAHHVVPEPLVERVVDVMVETIMEAPSTSVLGYRMKKRALPLEVTPFSIGVLAALRSFGSFSLDKLITVPKFLLWRGQQRIADRFTSTLHGDDGDARVVLGRDPIGDLSIFVRDLQQAEREKAAVLAQLERTTVEIDFADAQYREVWSAMRTLAFSMYDGQMGVARSESLQGQMRSRLVASGFELPDVNPTGVGDAMQKSLVLPTKSNLFPDWREPYEVSQELSDLLDQDMAHLAGEVGWISIEDAEALKHAVDQRGEALERAVTVAHERRSELLTDLARDLELHCEFELAQGQLNDWLVSTAGRDVSPAAVDRLRRTLARLPGSVSGLAREIIDAHGATVDVAVAADIEVDVDADVAGDVAPDVAADVDADVDADVEAAAHHEPDAEPDADAEAERLIGLAAEQPSVPFRAGPSPTVERSDAPPGPLRSLWRRLRAWWVGRRPDERVVHTFGPEEAREITETLASRVEEHLAYLDDEISGLRKAEEELETEIEDLARRVEALDAAAQPFRAWFGRNSRSFAWRLVDRMRGERRLLAAHVEATRVWLAAPLPVSPEEARELYEQFVRRIRRIFTWGLIVPGIAFILLRTVLSGLARRLGEWITSGPVGDFIETDVGQVLASAVRSFLGNPWPWLLGIVASATLYAFIAYYRVWSARQRKVRQLRSDVDHMRSWVHDLKVERSRLHHLERHANDVLRLLSEFLHRPFIIPSQPIRGRSAGPVGGAESTMSLSVAEPLWDARWQGQHAFESRIVARHARRGWLEDAYRDLGATVEEVTGQPRGSFGIEQLESSARTRQALLQLLENPNDDPRITIGQRMEREVLREMIGWDLSDDLPFPVVVETRVPATDGIDVRLDLLDDERHGVHPWVDFMLHGLPSADANGVSDEWASWTISVAASDGVRQDLRTVVHGPARYERAVERRRPGSFIPLRDREIRPVELVIRVDYALDRSLVDIRGCEQAGAEANGSLAGGAIPVLRTVPGLDEDLDV